MRRFLTYSSLVVAILLSVLALGEYAVRQTPNQYKTKFQYLQAHSDDIETLILGNSLAYYDFKPEFIPSSFNLGNIDQRLGYDCFMLDKFGDRMTNLKNVILTIGYCSLFDSDFEECDAWWYAINYKIYMDCDYHSDLSKYNFEFMHPAVFRGKLFSIFTGSEIGCDSLGWGKDFTLAAKLPGWDTESAQAAVERHTAPTWDSLEKNKNYLRHIINYCKRRNVRLVLVTPPMWHTYFENLDPRQLSKHYEVINEFVSVCDIEFCDYMKGGGKLWTYSR